MLHGEGVVVAQVRVPDDTNEITQVEELVGKLPEIPGRAVVTLDAVHARHATAELLMKAEMDDIFTIKRNQSTLERKIFKMVLPFLQEAPRHEVEERDRGRIKNWRTWATEANGIDSRQAATAGRHPP
jgi:predicted transposase YbfD/YdcC